MHSLSIYVVCASGLLVVFYGCSSYQPVSPKTWQANIIRFLLFPKNIPIKPLHLLTETSFIKLLFACLYIFLTNFKL